MASVNLAAGVTADAVTNAVGVAQSRCYILWVEWGAGTATVVPEFSLNGDTFFSLAPGVLTNLSSSATGAVYTITDFPVVQVRLNISGIANGAAVHGGIGWA